MKRKNFIYVVLAGLVMFAVVGCETVPKKFKEEVSGIKTRVETLETKVESVESKQAEVERTANEQAQKLEEMKATGEAKTNISVKPRGGKSKEWIKELQTCLKNAGFYTGKIDGVKGRNTRRAIREFQRANGLTADGAVGKKTWELLSKYTSSAAQSAGGSEERATK